MNNRFISFTKALAEGLNKKQKDLTLSVGDTNQAYPIIGLNGLFNCCDVSEVPVISALANGNKKFISGMKFLPSNENVFIQPYLTNYTLNGNFTNYSYDGTCLPGVGFNKSANVQTRQFPFACFKANAVDINLSSLIGSSKCLPDIPGIEALPNSFKSSWITDSTIGENNYRNAIVTAVYDLSIFMTNLLNKWVLVGDPSVNPFEPVGLLNQIEINPTTPALSSDIKNFNFASLCDTCNGANPSPFAGGAYNAIKYILATIRHNAMTAGYSALEVEIIVHPNMIEELAKCISCSKMDECDGGLFYKTDVITERSKITSSRTVEIDGYTYKIIGDTSIPLTVNPSSPMAGLPGFLSNVSVPLGSYSSNIYFLPKRVDGKDGYFGHYKSYSDMEALDNYISSNFGGSSNNFKVVDGGRVILTKEQIATCIRISAETCIRPILAYPHFAGALTNVVFCPLQYMKDENFNGGGLQAINC